MTREVTLCGAGAPTSTRTRTARGPVVPHVPGRRGPLLARSSGFRGPRPAPAVPAPPPQRSLKFLPTFPRVWPGAPPTVW